MSSLESSRDRVSSIVLERVADREATPADALPPLYDTVDPMLIDRLFDADAVRMLEFEYAGYTVRVERADTTGLVVDVQH